jgi:DNA-binding NarL/FixJ family response regulator
VIVYTQLSGIDPQLHNDFLQEAYQEFKKRLDTADPDRMNSFESTIKQGARRARSKILDSVIRGKRFVSMGHEDIATIAVFAQIEDAPLTEIVASSREKIGLSDLEFTVLSLHAEGYNGKEISSKLNRPYVTVVTNHRRAIRKIRNWISLTNYRREDG